MNKGWLVRLVIFLFFPTAVHSADLRCQFEGNFSALEENAKLRILKCDPIVVSLENQLNKQQLSEINFEALKRFDTSGYLRELVAFQSSDEVYESFKLALDLELYESDVIVFLLESYLKKVVVEEGASEAGKKIASLIGAQVTNDLFIHLLTSDDPEIGYSVSELIFNSSVEGLFFEKTKKAATQFLLSQTYGGSIEAFESLIYTAGFGQDENNTAELLKVTREFGIANIPSSLASYLFIVIVEGNSQETNTALTPEERRKLFEQHLQDPRALFVAKLLLELGAKLDGKVGRVAPVVGASKFENCVLASERSVLSCITEFKIPEVDAGYTEDQYILSGLGMLKYLSEAYGLDISDTLPKALISDVLSQDISIGKKQYLADQIFVGQLLSYPGISDAALDQLRLSQDRVSKFMWKTNAEELAGYHDVYAFPILTSKQISAFSKSTDTSAFVGEASRVAANDSNEVRAG